MSTVAAALFAEIKTRSFERTLRNYYPSRRNCSSLAEILKTQAPGENDLRLFSSEPFDNPDIESRKDGTPCI
ncbi:MAG: hypothetical protein K8F91_01175, partial [Candidatus Obscuribacterales bacterium]|nr:hypothetical protein [Candidatus Obscuribacterales bacterium]